MLKIFTFAHKRPDFIGLQVRSFRQYLQEPFEFVVFNNAAFDQHRGPHDEINRQCDQWGAQVIDVQKEPEIVDWCQAQEITGPLFHESGRYSNPNVACAYPLCWAWARHISKETSPICFLDSDIFLIQPVCISERLQTYDLCYIPQFRVGAAEYMWNAFFSADLSRLPNPSTLNWWCGRVNDVPVDVGGQTCHYLKDHPELKVLRIHSAFIPDDPKTNFHPTNYEHIYFDDKLFGLHYRSGSNWNHQPAIYHEKKTRWLLEQLNLKG